MLNKKTIFNVVYATAVIGLISTCFGLLTELTNFLELRKPDLFSGGVHEFYNHEEKKIITYFTVALLLCLSSTIAFLIPLFCKKKKVSLISVMIASALSVATCVTMLFFTSSLLKIFARSSLHHSGTYGHEIRSAGYLVCTTFRTAALTFACYAAILIVCNVIHCIYKTKNTPNQGNETAE